MSTIFEPSEMRVMTVFTSCGVSCCASSKMKKRRAIERHLADQRPAVIGDAAHHIKAARSLSNKQVVHRKILLSVALGGTRRRQRSVAASSTARVFGSSQAAAISQGNPGKRTKVWVPKTLSGFIR